jgi:hypothetical protein
MLCSSIRLTPSRFTLDDRSNLTLLAMYHFAPLRGDRTLGARSRNALRSKHFAPSSFVLECEAATASGAGIDAALGMSFK